MTFQKTFSSFFSNPVFDPHFRAFPLIALWKRRYAVDNGRNRFSMARTIFGWTFKRVQNQRGKNDLPAVITKIFSRFLRNAFPMRGLWRESFYGGSDR
jgi:hypothetical protein